MNALTAVIPCPLQIVIDDVGWWQGSGGHGQEPFRTGMPRRHLPADILPLAELGRRLGIRPQIALVLAEWDLDGILRRLPESTWLGENWRGQPENASVCAEAADLIRLNRLFLEVTLHGLGHEYWLPDGERSRAEWYSNDGVMRPADQVRQHLDAYAQLLERHNLGPLPESFVPCAFCYAFGHGEDELAGILREYGIRRISTPFSRMHRHRPTEGEHYGIDAGIVITDRDSNPVPWSQVGIQPEQLNQISSTLGLHWPNLLHVSPERSTAAIDTIVNALDKIRHSCGRMLSATSADHQSQLLYHELTGVHPAGDSVRLDFRRFLQRYGKHPERGLDVHLVAPDQTFTAITLKPKPTCPELRLPLA